MLPNFVIDEIIYLFYLSVKIYNENTIDYKNKKKSTGIGSLSLISSKFLLFASVQVIQLYRSSLLNLQRVIFFVLRPPLLKPSLYIFSFFFSVASRKEVGSVLLVLFLPSQSLQLSPPPHVFDFGVRSHSTLRFLWNNLCLMICRKCWTFGQLIVYVLSLGRSSIQSNMKS